MSNSAAADISATLADTPPPLKENVDEVEDKQHEYSAGIRLASIMTALLFSIFLASLDVTIISTAIPQITRDFHSLEDVGWYGTAMLFPVAATQSMWGKAFKYFPVKVVYLISILIFEIGSLLCATSQNSSMFIAGRAITGTGAAGTFSGSYLVIALSSSPKIRPVLQSALSAVFAIASIVGPLIGGAMTQNVSWRWCFYINLPLGGVAAAAFFFAFNGAEQDEARGVSLKEKLLQMDLIGVVLVSAAVICFTLSMEWAGVEKSWSSGDVIGTLITSIVCVALFVVNERYQGDRAFITSKVLRQTTLRTAGIFEFFIAGSFYIGLFYLPIYFQAVRGVSALSSGVRLIPLILGLTLSQIAVGITITATGHFMPFMIGGPVLAAVGSGLLMLLKEQSPSGAWIGYQVVIGIGAGACLTIPMMLSQVVVPEEDVAIATAAMIFCQATGGAFIIAAAQAIFQNQLVHALHRFAPDIDPLSVLSLGATDNALASLPPSVLPGIVHGYVVALKYVFALGIPISGIAFFVAFLQPWIRYDDPRKKTDTQDGGADGKVGKVEGTTVAEKDTM